eukprot:s659_g11.t1
MCEKVASDNDGSRNPCGHGGKLTSVANDRRSESVGICCPNGVEPGAGVQCSSGTWQKHVLCGPLSKALSGRAILDEMRGTWLQRASRVNGQNLPTLLESRMAFQGPRQRKDPKMRVKIDKAMGILGTDSHRLHPFCVSAYYAGQRWSWKRGRPGWSLVREVPSKDCYFFKTIEIPYDKRQQLLMVDIFEVEPTPKMNIPDDLIGRATMPLADPRLEQPAEWPLARGPWEFVGTPRDLHCHLLPVILRVQTPRVTVSVEFPAPEARCADALCFYRVQSGIDISPFDQPRTRSNSKSSGGSSPSPVWVPVLNGPDGGFGLNPKIPVLATVPPAVAAMVVEALRAPPLTTASMPPPPAAVLQAGPLPYLPRTSMAAQYYGGAPNLSGFVAPTAWNLVQVPALDRAVRNNSVLAYSAAFIKRVKSGRASPLAAYSLCYLNSTSAINFPWHLRSQGCAGRPGSMGTCQHFWGNLALEMEWNPGVKFPDLASSNFPEKVSGTKGTLRASEKKYLEVRVEKANEILGMAGRPWATLQLADPRVEQLAEYELARGPFEYGGTVTVSVKFPDPEARFAAVETHQLPDLRDFPKPVSPCEYANSKTMGQLPAGGIDMSPFEIPRKGSGSSSNSTGQGKSPPQPIWVPEIKGPDGSGFGLNPKIDNSWKCCQQWDNEPPAEFLARVVYGKTSTRNPAAASIATVGIPAPPSAARADGPASYPRDGAFCRGCNGGGSSARTAADNAVDASTSCIGAASRALALLAQNISGCAVLWRRSESVGICCPNSFQCSSGTWQKHVPCGLLSKGTPMAGKNKVCLMQINTIVTWALLKAQNITSKADQ